MRSQDQNYGRANGHSKPKVLVPEKVSADGLAQLRKTLQVDERKGLTPDQLLEMIAEYDALIVRSETKVTAPLLQAGKRLKVVARAGVGVDNVGKEDLLVMSHRSSAIDCVNRRSGCDEVGSHCSQLAVWEHRCSCRAYHCFDASLGKEHPRCVLEPQGGQMGKEQARGSRDEGKDAGHYWLRER